MNKAKQNEAEIFGFGIPYPEDKKTTDFTIKKLKRLKGFIGVNISSTFVVYVIFNTEENANNGKETLSKKYGFPCGEVKQGFIPKENAITYEERKLK